MLFPISAFPPNPFPSLQTPGFGTLPVLALPADRMEQRAALPGSPREAAAVRTVAPMLLERQPQAPVLYIGKVSLHQKTCAQWRELASKWTSQDGTGPVRNPKSAWGSGGHTVAQDDPAASQRSGKEEER